MQFVTARHVIERIASKTADGQVLLRFNTEDALEEEWLLTPLSEWLFHPDPRVDVATLPTHSRFATKYDHSAWPAHGVLTNELIKILDVGIGDSLVFPGLYVHRKGDINNIPILRMGNIASMSRHPVKTKKGWMPAYLCEARSIGGLSGSPVYVRVPPERVPLGDGYGNLMLFGMIHGHIDSDHCDDASSTDSLFGYGGVNSGIAVVVPAQDILETIEAPENSVIHYEIRDHFQSVSVELSEKAHSFHAALGTFAATGPNWCRNFPINCGFNSCHLLGRYLFESGLGEWHVVTSADQSHAWLQKGTTVIDITSGQFPGLAPTMICPRSLFDSKHRLQEEGRSLPAVTLENDQEFYQRIVRYLHAAQSTSSVSL